MREFCVAMILAPVLAGCTVQQAPTPVAAAPLYSEFRDLTEAEKKIIAQGLARGLKDPESARFRWARFAKTADASVTYCLMINAKNSYGGYIGFQTHVAFVSQANGRIIGAVLDGTDRGLVGGTPFCKERGLDLPSDA